MQLNDFDAAAGYLPDELFRNPPDLGILLGSGWGSALVMDEILQRIPYSDIPGLGGATVKGHAGEFVYYRRHGKTVAAWCGRRHYYEGVGWPAVVMPVEILRRMGCPSVLLTNASGGINPALQPGDFVVIRDHFSLLGENPLIGPHVEEWGERFPDMTEVYARHLAELLHASANRLGLRAMDGVYACMPGPCFETPAEIRALKTLGADVVGMSTVPEAVFARACGLQVAGLSLVANLAAGISLCPMAHEEVMAAARAARDGMRDLIDGFLERI